MCAKIGAAGKLEINPCLSVVKPQDQFGKKLCQLLLRYARSDADAGSTLKKPCYVLFKHIDLVVAAEGYVIYAVAEIACSVQHGNGDAIQLVDSSIIKTECFHSYISLLLLLM